MNGIIGRKLGMTRIFDDTGQVVPVTIIEAGPCPIVQVRTDSQGRRSIQLGFGSKKPTRTPKALAGHAKAAGLEAAPVMLREFAVSNEGDGPTPGDVVTVAAFASGDAIKVTGTTKGRGFQGVVKRHGFHGGPKTHGNTRYRRPGSLGPGTDPSRVIKGKKMPGQYGSTRHTEVGLSVVRVDEERNLLFVRGAVPGPTRGLVTVNKHGGRSRYA